MTDRRIADVLTEDKLQANTGAGAGEIAFDGFANLVTRSRIINRALSSTCPRQSCPGPVPVRLHAGRGWAGHGTPTDDLIIRDFQGVHKTVRTGVGSEDGAHRRRGSAEDLPRARCTPGTQIGSLFEKSSQERSGAVATYIPQLATVPPEQFGSLLWGRRRHVVTRVN